MTLLIFICLFTVLPALELYLLITVGSAIGVLDTIALVLLTGIAGAWIARAQGQGVFFEVSGKMKRGELPADALFGGVLIFLGGVLMLTPGFITDAIGLSMILPFTRQRYMNGIKAFILKKIKNGTIHVHTSHPFDGQAPWGTYEEVEIREVWEEDEAENPHPIRDAKVIDISDRFSKNDKPPHPPY